MSDIEKFEFGKKPLIIPPSKEPMPIGRPSVITDDIKEKICKEISTTSKGLRVICTELGVSYESMRRTLLDDDDFRASYTCAKENQADHIVEESLEIADETVNEKDIAAVNRNKLRVETRLKIASYLKPRQYGKQSNENVTLDIKHSISDRDDFNKLMQAAITKKKQIDSNTTDIEFEEVKS